MAFFEPGAQGILPGTVTYARALSARRPFIDTMSFAVESCVIVATLAFIAAQVTGVVIHHYVYLGFVAVGLRQFSPHVAPSSCCLIRGVLLNWGLVGVWLLMLGYLTASMELFSGSILIQWYLTSASMLLLWRFALRAAMPRVSSLTRSSRAIIVGANTLGLHFAERIRDNNVGGLSLVGFVDDRAFIRSPEPRELTLGTLGETTEVIAKYKVDRIYIALPMSSQPRILALLDQLRDTTASIYFVPDIFISDLIQARVDEVAGFPVVAVCETPFYGRRAFAKRLSDLVLASAALALLWPALVAIAISVKMSSPGPVIFKQRRHGLDGREIWIYKFRTMTVCEDGGAVVQAVRNDARVTRVGAFLRRYSLDELPQLFNVLQGRMSMVGPRPHAVAHNELYRKLVKGYMVRHKIRPGITGWAQVNGLRGETKTVEKMKARIDFDLEYLRIWSLRLDLKILIRTIVVVATGYNAY